MIFFFGKRIYFQLVFSEKQPSAMVKMGFSGAIVSIGNFSEIHPILSLGDRGLWKPCAAVATTAAI